MADSILRELFKSAFKNIPLDKNELSEYSELDEPEKINNEMEANNSQNISIKNPKTENGQNIFTKISDGMEANNKQNLNRDIKEANNGQTMPVRNSKDENGQQNYGGE